jgi:hypothetical protein
VLFVSIRGCLLFAKRSQSHRISSIEKESLPDY